MVAPIKITRSAIKYIGSFVEEEAAKGLSRKELLGYVSQRLCEEFPAEEDAILPNGERTLESRLSDMHIRSSADLMDAIDMYLIDKEMKDLADRKPVTRRPRKKKVNEDGN